MTTTQNHTKRPEVIPCPRPFPCLAHYPVKNTYTTLPSLRHAQPLVCRSRSHPRGIPGTERSPTPFVPPPRNLPVSNIMQPTMPLGMQRNSPLTSDKFFDLGFCHLQQARRPLGLVDVVNELRGSRSVMGNGTGA